MVGQHLYHNTFSTVFFPVIKVRGINKLIFKFESMAILFTDYVAKKGFEDKY